MPPRISVPSAVGIGGPGRGTADGNAASPSARRPTKCQLRAEKCATSNNRELRATLIRHRTRVGNSIRAHMAEFGLIAPIGRIGLESLVRIICDEKDERITSMVRRALGYLVNQCDQLQAQILDCDRQVLAWHRSNETSR